MDDPIQLEVPPVPSPRRCAACRDPLGSDAIRRTRLSNHASVFVCPSCKDDPHFGRPAIPSPYDLAEGLKRRTPADLVAAMCRPCKDVLAAAVLDEPPLRTTLDRLCSACQGRLVLALLKLRVAATPIPTLPGQEGSYHG